MVTLLAVFCICLVPFIFQKHFNPLLSPSGSPGKGRAVASRPFPRWGSEGPWMGTAASNFRVPHSLQEAACSLITRELIKSPLRSYTFLPK